MVEEPAPADASGAATGSGLPQTPHELPYDRGRVDDLLTRIRDGGTVDLLEELLDAVDWQAFGGEGGAPISAADRERLRDYYRRRFGDVGPLYLAELLSTEFMTEQRARGDVVFSERLLALGRNDPELWAEIRRFFRLKEMTTALLVAAHRGPGGPAAAPGDAGREAD